MVLKGLQIIISLTSNFFNYTFLLIFCLQIKETSKHFEICNYEVEYFMRKHCSSSWPYLFKVNKPGVHNWCNNDILCLTEESPFSLRAELHSSSPSRSPLLSCLIDCVSSLCWQLETGAECCWVLLCVGPRGLVQHSSDRLIDSSWERKRRRPNEEELRG